MKALILVGGYGTRLRPLTFSLPKPLVPFINKPIVVHQIEALVKVGVKEIILAVNYQPQVMLDFLKDCEKEFGIKITCSKEDVPLGTAGPIGLARELLLKDDTPFFMFNSDVICDFPLQDMLNFHKAHGQEGTIMVTRVDDPSKYGVVVTQKDGRIDRFVEKPKDFVSDRINAGIYLFNVDIIKRVKPVPTSIEREIFPAMAREEKLFAMDLKGYWMDIGQPKDYLKGLVLHLDSHELKVDAEKYRDSTLKGHVVIHETAKIGKGCVIGPDVCIGPHVEIGDGARVQKSAIFDGCRIGAHAFIRSSIVGWECIIGKWARVDACVMGKDVEVGDEVFANGITVCPHKTLKTDETEARVIL